MSQSGDILAPGDAFLAYISLPREERERDKLDCIFNAYEVRGRLEADEAEERSAAVMAGRVTCKVCCDSLGRGEECADMEYTMAGEIRLKNKIVLPIFNRRLSTNGRRSQGA